MYMLGRKLFSPTVGLLAAILLAINPGQMWFARYVNSEILFQLFLLTSMWGLAEHLPQGEPCTGLLAGLSFGELLMVRLEGTYLGLSLLMIILYLLLTGQLYRENAWFLMPLGMMAFWAGGHAYLISWPYVHLVWRNMALGLGYGAVFGLAVALGLALFALVLLLRFRLGVRRIRSLTSRAQLPSRRLVAALLLASSLVGYFLLPRLGPPETYALPWGELSRSYREENFLRLGWYLSPWGLWLGLGGVALCILHQPRKENAFPVLAVLSTALLLPAKSWITPDHFFAGRRYLPVLIPCLTLFASFAVVRLGDYVRPARLGELAARALVVAMAGYFIWAISPFLSHREFAGAIAQTEQLAQVFPKDSLLIFDKSLAGNYLATPLKFIYDREVLLAGEERLEPARFQEAALMGLARGKEVFYLAAHAQILPPPGFGLICYAKFSLKATRMEHSYEHLPRQRETLELPFRIYKLSPTEGPALIRYGAEHLLHQTGKLVKDERAIGDTLAYADPERDWPGFLVYGPYENYPPGKYSVEFHLRVEPGAAPEQVLAVLDVFSISSDSSLGSLEVNGEAGSREEFKVLRFEFTNPRWQPLEFRVYFTGKAPLGVGSIIVYPLEYLGEPSGQEF